MEVVVSYSSIYTKNRPKSHAERRDLRLPMSTCKASTHHICHRAEPHYPTLSPCFPQEKHPQAIALRVV